jgi:very-short-patch-repair endonuclease
VFLSLLKKGDERGFSTMLLYNSELKRHARDLRKRMTDAEIRLWARLRLKRLNGYPFQRQRIIGNYIVDFYCPRAKLVIEVDGGQHYSSENMLSDKRRDNYLKSKRLTILRFSDTDVLVNTEVVIQQIVQSLEKNPLSQEQTSHFTAPGSPPLMKGERTKLY